MTTKMNTDGNGFWYRLRPLRDEREFFAQGLTLMRRRWRRANRRISVYLWKRRPA